MLLFCSQWKKLMKVSAQEFCFVGDSSDGQSQIELLVGEREESTKMNKNKLAHSHSFKNEITATCAVNG